MAVCCRPRSGGCWREPLSVASLKPPVIEALFRARYRSGRGIPSSRRIVTTSEVQTEIQRFNRGALASGGDTLSDRNPPNFLKDIVRFETRNSVFPASVVARGWTARQLTGNEQCFEFIPIPRGRTTAFEVIAPPPSRVKNPYRVQSLSLPGASRRFGKKDESWLTEVATHLGLIELHLALSNPHNLLSVTRLASHLKLGKGEADALYYGEDTSSDSYLIACEMKGEPREVLDQEQILRVAEAVASTTAAISARAEVIPLGVKVLWPGYTGGQRGLIWIRQYDTSFPPLVVASERVYKLVPEVQGIG